MSFESKSTRGEYGPRTQNINNLIIALRPTSVEVGQVAMELSLAPEFTICPTPELTLQKLDKVQNSKMGYFKLKS